MPGGGHHQRGDTFWVDRMILGLYVSAEEEEGTHCPCFEPQSARTRPRWRAVIRSCLRRMNQLAGCMMLVVALARLS